MSIDEVYPDKAGDDPPDYPREWGAEERSTAYWYALRLDKNGGAFPQTTDGWRSILEQADRVWKRHTAIRRDPPGLEPCRRCGNQVYRNALDRAGLCPSCRLAGETAGEVAGVPLSGQNGDAAVVDYDPGPPW